MQCRAELVTDLFLESLRGLDVTLEFGIQTIHETEAEIINRKIDIRKIEQALASLKSRGIKHEVSLIFGLPTQTLSSFKASVSWCLAHKIPVIKAFPLMLLRGTKLAGEASRWSMKESETTIPWVKSSDSFTEDDWFKMDAIAVALRNTETRHPEKLNELALEAPYQFAAKRWCPAALTQREI